MTQEEMTDVIKAIYAYTYAAKGPGHNERLADAVIKAAEDAAGARMDDAKAAEIAARLQAITPGPWHIVPARPSTVWVSGLGRVAYVYNVGTGPSKRKANAEFIASAPDDVEDLLADRVFLRRLLSDRIQDSALAAEAVRVDWELAAEHIERNATRMTAPILADNIRAGRHAYGRFA